MDDRARGAGRALVPRRPRRLRAAAESCCAAVERRAAICLAGNHDLGVLGEIDLEEFSGDAVAAARWTRGVLGRRIARLPRVAAAAWRRGRGVELFHASPRDPVWEYVLIGGRRGAAFELTDRAARARRPQPRPARRSRSRATPARRRPRAGRHRDRRSTPAAGCSTPARSASRATATRARPGCCSTSSAGTAVLPPGRVRRRRARRRRSARGGCPMRWRNGLLTASSAIVLAGCGGGGAQGRTAAAAPRIPADVAARLAAEADRVAALAPGTCAARDAAARFRQRRDRLDRPDPVALPGAAHLRRQRTRRAARDLRHPEAGAPRSARGGTRSTGSRTITGTTTEGQWPDPPESTGSPEPSEPARAT